MKVKKHLVSIFWDTEVGNFTYVGLVTGENLENNKVRIDPDKLFYNLFGFKYKYGTVTYG